MEEQLIETWSIHDRINRYLLAAVQPDALGAVAAGKGRDRPTLASWCRH
jgi:hypothetical protein